MADIEAIIDCKQYSNKTKLLQVMAWVNRFFAKVRRHQVSASINITPQEFKASEKLWVKADTSKKLRRRQKVSSGNSKYGNLVGETTGYFPG